MLTAAEGGYELTSGFHIRTNSTLEMIASNPNDYTEISSFGTFDTALTNNHWDHVTLQIFGDFNSDLEGDLQQLANYRDLTLSNPANSATNFYVYQSWPWRTNWNNWDNPVVDSPTQSTQHSEPYFDLLMNHLDASSPGEFRLIPVGEVLNRVRDEITAGTAPARFNSINRLYRDPIHLNATGQYVASTTVYATILKQNPMGLPVPRVGEGAWTEDLVSDEEAAWFQEIIWDVVWRQRWTGVSPEGDFDVSTVVDEIDYGLWNDQFGFNEAITADADKNGRVDSADIAVYQSALNPVADYNQDGRPDAGDYALWAAAYGTVGPSAADGNQDGVVDLADFTIWNDVALAYQAADFNDDGWVNYADLELLVSQFGWKTELESDGNNDGVVDVADYTVWRDNYLAAASLSQAVPEPHTGFLLVIVGLFAGRGRANARPRR
ncbi:DUF4886 domain-containing protein [Botrimarina hoheduenensis]|uniref:DUF4886 domain-containing protein n=1 Tax=Botrimarina hoheduenensis TaxID=2528000 RepID=UPI0011B3D8FC|nr:DUF4886 domain-containing protein [Botrimarina hoheduenensis]